jgi:hypothetical protein
VETSRLEIGCAAIKYLVPAAHPAPLRVRDRLDRIIERELPRMLARAFDSWFSDNDPSIWIIRQLQIQAVVNVAREPDQITRTVTTQIAKHLGATFQDDNQDNVRHFPSRAAYLASFLADLSFGTAKSQWYYQSFAGLNVLPLSGALRTALCDDARIGNEALRLLPASELLRVLQSLTGQDARQVLERIASDGASADASLCHDLVIEAAMNNGAALNDLADESQRALYLFIAAINETKGSHGAALKHMAHKVARDKGSWSKPMAVPGARGQPYRRSTALGGIFLLLAHLDELPLAEATRDWPNIDEAAAISLVRFLGLLKCCGCHNSERAFYDPLIRDLLLIPPSLSPEVLQTWQAQLKREHLETFLETLMERQWARGAIGGKEQLLFISQYRGDPLLVLIDAARGLWLLLDGYSVHHRREVTAALRPALVRLMEEEGTLCSDPPLIDMLQAEFTGLHVIKLSDHTIDMAGPGKPAIDAIVARLDKLPEELEFLRSPQSFAIARQLDLALSIVAQHLLRQIAYGLPGFAGSNLPYLSRNFFEFAATVEEEPARRVVRLGRPPLHLILNMTGLNRQSYRLSWLDERPFALFQGE